jgi:hypothetical protein
VASAAKMTIMLIASVMVITAPTVTVSTGASDDTFRQDERESVSPLPEFARTNPRAFAAKLLAGRQTKPTIHVGENARS